MHGTGLTNCAYTRLASFVFSSTLQAFRISWLRWTTRSSRRNPCSSQLFPVPFDHIPVRQVPAKDIESTSHGNVYSTIPSCLHHFKICEAARPACIRYRNLHKHGGTVSLPSSIPFRGFALGFSKRAVVKCIEGRCARLQSEIMSAREPISFCTRGCPSS
jgi:hypothetical protein